MYLLWGHKWRTTSNKLNEMRYDLLFSFQWSLEIWKWVAHNDRLMIFS